MNTTANTLYCLEIAKNSREEIRREPLLFEKYGMIVVGSGLDCHIRIRGERLLQARHIQFYQDDRGIWIAPIYGNHYEQNNIIKKQPSRLSPYDEIGIGGIQIKCQPIECGRQIKAHYDRNDDQSSDNIDPLTSEFASDCGQYLDTISSEEIASTLDEYAITDSSSSKKMPSVESGSYQRLDARVFPVTICDSKPLENEDVDEFSPDSDVYCANLDSECDADEICEVAEEDPLWIAPSSLIELESNTQELPMGEDQQPDFPPLQEMSPNAGNHRLGGMSVALHNHQLHGEKDCYRIDVCLGQGAKATVYKGIAQSDGVHYAVKVLNADNLEDFSRFRLEIQMGLDEINHPNLVKVHDMGDEMPHPFMVMELVSGQTLEKMIQEYRIVKLNDCCRIIIQTCDALNYLHSLNIIHRDIKPANIMVTDDGQVKLTDLGLAKSHSHRLGITQHIIGSPSYMAPEQIRDSAKVTTKCDIYSLGATLFEMLTGQVPFIAESYEQLFYAKLSSPPPDPRIYNDYVPARLAKTVMAMLEKLPDKRPDLKKIQKVMRRCL